METISVLLGGISLGIVLAVLGVAAAFRKAYQEAELLGGDVIGASMLLAEQEAQRVA